LVCFALSRFIVQFFIGVRVSVGKYRATSFLAILPK